MQMTHKHDVYFSPYSTEAHNLVMQIVNYCEKRGIWYKISESTLGIGIEYGGNVAYVITADRKTENSSEKPNNSKEMIRYDHYTDKFVKVSDRECPWCKAVCASTDKYCHECGWHIADTPQAEVYDYKGNGKWERSE